MSEALQLIDHLTDPTYQRRVALALRFSMPRLFSSTRIICPDSSISDPCVDSDSFQVKAWAGESNGYMMLDMKMQGGVAEHPKRYLHVWMSPSEEVQSCIARCRPIVTEGPESAQIDELQSLRYEWNYDPKMGTYIPKVRLGVSMNRSVAYFSMPNPEEYGIPGIEAMTRAWGDPSLYLQGLVRACENPACENIPLPFER